MSDTKKIEEKNKLYEKLVRLEEQHKDVNNMKKAAAKDYRDQLKDIKGEIEDTVDAIKKIDE